jgi:dTDP-4-dehydrorhamnose reductase
VISVIFKVSGEETLDVVTLPYGAPVSLDAISTHILKIPNDDTSRIRLAVTNTGDAAVYDMTVNVFPGLQSSLGITCLWSSNIESGVFCYRT